MSEEHKQRTSSVTCCGLRGWSAECLPRTLGRRFSGEGPQTCSRSPEIVAELIARLRP